MSVEQAAREVDVIGAPLDLGAGRRGVDMGPSAIRYAELEQSLSQKLGLHVTPSGCPTCLAEPAPRGRQQRSAKRS